MPGFGLFIPKHCEGIDNKILNPINTWRDKNDFIKTSKKVAEKFINNFKKYTDGTPADVIKEGGPDLSKF